MLIADAEPSTTCAHWLETVFAPLWRLFHVDRFAVIDGVTLDLRHPDLDPWEWCIDTLWTDPDYGWQQGPRLWFPWFGPLDIVGRSAEALSWAKVSPHSFDEWLARALPVADVTAGCKVEVAKLDVRLLDGHDFDHEHDAETRHAYLRVVRPDGHSEVLDQPLCFRGATAFGSDPYWSGITHEKVVARICGLIGVRSVDSFEFIEWSDDPTEIAFNEAQALADAIARWVSVPAGIEADAPALAGEALTAIVNGAVSLGYRYAQAEAGRRLVPLAMAGLASAKGATLAGYRSGEARRLKAESTWHPQALELARRSRAVNTSNSQDAVVADIQAGWKTEIPACPGTKTLKGFVSAKEATGELARRGQLFRVANRVHVAT